MLPGAGRADAPVHASAADLPAVHGDAWPPRPAAPMSAADANDGHGWYADREVVRTVHDEGTGSEWRIFERDAREVPGSRGPRCLYFDSDGLVRRVWRYPADWHQMPAAALLSLMDRPPLEG